MEITKDQIIIFLTGVLRAMLAGVGGAAMAHGFSQSQWNLFLSGLAALLVTFGLTIRNKIYHQIEVQTALRLKAGSTQDDLKREMTTAKTVKSIS